MERANFGSSTTYRLTALALRRETIHRICEALEILMEEDVAAGRRC